MDEMRQRSGRRLLFLYRTLLEGVPLHGFMIGGYTRDGDAEPGTRCKSDTVLATVTRELEPHVATGPTGLGRQG